MAEGCGVGIVGIGVGLPAAVRRNDWWTTAFEDRGDFVRGAERRMAERGAAVRTDPFAGTVERRVLEDGRLSSDLEAEAGRDALAAAGLAPAAIDLLIGYSTIPDHLIPGNTGRVARALGLGSGTTAIGLDAGCASFLPQLTTATRLVQAGDHAAALLFQSSAISRVTDYRLPSSVLGGDGAVAQVVAAVEPGLGFVGSVQRLRSDLCDGIVLNREDGGMDWYRGGEGGRLLSVPRDPDAAHAMGADGPQLAAEACRAVLEKTGHAVADVDFFVCAQATAWFGPACAAAIGVPPERTVPLADHFERYGHLLTASAPLNLWVAWATGRLKKGDLVLAYSPGVGFATAATLMRWAMDPPAVTPRA